MTQGPVTHGLVGRLGLGRLPILPSLSLIHTVLGSTGFLLFGGSLWVPTAMGFLLGSSIELFAEKNPKYQASAWVLDRSLRQQFPRDPQRHVVLGFIWSSKDNNVIGVPISFALGSGQPKDPSF